MSPVEIPRRSASYVLMAQALLLSSVSAQSGPEIMSRAMTAQAERLAGVENVTITQATMGMPMTVYMEKRDMGGVPTLVPVSMVMGGQVTAMPEEASSGDWSNPFREEWVERARLEGEEELDGHPVQILVMDDFSGLEVPSLPGDRAGSGFEPKTIRFWVDEDDLLMRKMEMEAEARQDDGTTAPVQITMYLGDFREVSGYIHPFMTRVVSKGILEAANVDQAELQEQLAMLRKRLADLPEAQRAMMEGMLNSQIQMVEEMLGSGEGVEMTITVTDLKVNAGPPSRLLS